MKIFFSGALFVALTAASLAAIAGGNIDNGKALTAKYSCAGCHGADFNSPVDPSYPKLAGQHADYLEHALVAYKRGNDVANGRGNAIMGGMAKPLSHTEMVDIAAYLSSLPGSLVKVK
jgi:cytochrome c553